MTTSENTVSLSGSATDCRKCPFIVVFLPIIRPNPFTKMWQKGRALAFVPKTKKSLESHKGSRDLELLARFACIFAQVWAKIKVATGF